MTITPSAIAGLAAVVAELRDEWTRDGLTAVLKRCQGYPLEAVTISAIDAALTAETATPAGILARLEGRWPLTTLRRIDRAAATSPASRPVADLWRHRPPAHERRPGPSDEQRQMIRAALEHARGIRAEPDDTTTDHPEGAPR